MTTLQMGITIAMCTAATMLTRFLPFLIFSSKDQQPPEVVQYLGRVLPAAIFGMLILYCLKSVTPFAGSHGIPEAIAIAVTIALHRWKHQTLVSITCSAEPPEGVDRGWFMFFITLLDQIYWVASAGLGAVVGLVLPFSTEGVDFVMTAMRSEERR